ncbi:lysoplasmalogenase family protein [Paenibacillus sp. HGH0039]|nr:lysoplasmalogenase family protein [Paenibacillus sp. HGH0039]EGL15421.1 YhhN-like protein [Paenibacillus sp. HGF7]EPD81899.1 hypothetical protein HMPREF1207_03725 [Paenibacillus sp. HGH0039]
MMMGWLWAVQVILFAAGTGLGMSDARRKSTEVRLPLWVRMLISLTLTAAAFALWRDDPASSSKEWIFWGMAWSFIGDLSMAGIIPWRHPMIGGMLTFAVAHVFYIAAFAAALHREGLDLMNAGLAVAAVFYGLVLIAAWLLLIRNPDAPRLFNTGSLVYGLWIGAMASAAAAMAWSLGGALWLTAVGGLLFVVSDTIIGAAAIGGRSLRHQGYWVWLTYVAAQMCIVYAFTL